MSGWILRLVAALLLVRHWQCFDGRARVSDVARGPEPVAVPLFKDGLHYTVQARLGGRSGGTHRLSSTLRPAIGAAEG